MDENSIPPPENAGILSPRQRADFLMTFKEEETGQEIVDRMAWLLVVIQDALSLPDGIHRIRHEIEVLSRGIFLYTTAFDSLFGEYKKKLSQHMRPADWVESLVEQIEDDLNS